MKPTMGRIVHYYNQSHPYVGPKAAIIVFVHHDNPTDQVNLTYFDQNGNVGSMCSVPSKEKCPDGFSCWWEWPPRE